MKTIRLCPTCASALPADAPDGLCPQCLLQTDGVTEAGGPGFKPTLGPEPGCLFGDYRIVRLLGEGGMGSVYEAEDVENGRRVALKVLRHAPDSPTARQRFLREGRLAASVNHPHSVYIYGAEEIDGAPVITMEYVPGGTLSELVKAHGPLSVAKAVDTILQIMEGLEAAAAKGVLHRDVKPSNCFIEADGAVKVGDFGLSISTLARDQTNLTMPGAIMGTPSYAPPEQLRGDELDVRADIYSVGVTLYFLLTGQTPFNADSMVKLLATVLEKPAPSPRLLRPEIPKAVEQAVLRCLAKEPAQRFKDYEELRQALLPFGSAEPPAAPLGLRLVAGIIDRILLGLFIVAGASILSILSGNEDLAFHELRSPKLMWEIWPLVGQALYYALCEGLWGAGIGKYICRLRVVGPNRGLPGLPRAFGRALIYIFTPRLPVWFLSGGMHADISVPMQAVGLLSVYFIHALFFVTARRRNGFASVYDLITGTRVVQHVAKERRSQQTLAEDSTQQASNAPMVGPFHVLESLGRRDSEEILLGYDTRLLRKVWIRKQPPGTAPIPAIQRDLTRKGRLHWLAGRRSAEECWDAYEAVAGQPLVSLLDAAQPWKSVRFWLLDLAEELDAARLDGSSPDTFCLDRVWITADGRAKLLDFPARGENGSGAKNSKPSAQQFLNQVAFAGLAGRPSEGANGSVPQIPMPLFARAFLQTLPAAPDLPSVLAELRPLLDKPAEVSSGRRRGLIYMSLFIACLCFGWVSIASGYMQGRQAPLWMFGAFALPSLTASLLFRRGLGLRLLKVEIVGKTGLPAPRWQTFLRCLLAWLPFLLTLLTIALVEKPWPLWIFLSALVGGIAYRLVRPGRAIRDRIVGTWLVPE
jgi:eukaryotic-like serine/threonine-protein kinase